MIGGQWLSQKWSDNCRWKLIRGKYMLSSIRSFLHLLCMKEKMDRAFYRMMYHQNFDAEILIKSLFWVWGIGWLVLRLMKVCQWSVRFINNQFRVPAFFYCSFILRSYLQCFLIKNTKNINLETRNI